MAKATLELKIVSNNATQILQYDLTGIGTEPLSEGHVFLKCELKKDNNHFFIIHNKNRKRTVTYKIESDIPNFYGPETFVLGPDVKEKYRFKIVPQLSGTYMGMVTFRE